MNQDFNENNNIKMYLEFLKKLYFTSPITVAKNNKGEYIIKEPHPARIIKNEDLK